MSLQELYFAAMQLPPEERYQLAALILDDDAGSDDFVFDVEAPEVVAEMRRRLADREGSMSWDKLRAE
jgi:hypothetical protein